MADYPYLRLWTDSYMRDCWHLSDAEHGRYFLLLVLMWQTPRCRIPNEPEWIAKHLRRSLDDYREQIEPLIKTFCTCDGNWIWQKRLLREWNFTRKMGKTQSDNAKSRWNKGKRLSRSDAKRMPNACQNDAPTSTSTSTSITKVEKKEAYASLLSHFENFWNAYPKRCGTNSKAKAVDKFKAAIASGVDPATIINGAIRYAAHCDAEQKTGTEFVQQTTTWLNQRGWENAYEQRTATAKNGSLRDSWAQAQEIIRKRKERQSGSAEDIDLLPGLRENGS